MNGLLFSVIIPTCDRNDALAECLRRLAPASQSLDSSRYEVIVTDDSIDGAARVLIARDFPWATWASGPRRGPASNRNAGARRASGAVLVFLDDDCVPEAGLLDGYAASLRDSVDVYEGRITVREGLPSPLWTAPENLVGGALWSCNFAIRRTAFDAVEGFDERFPLPHMEDVDLRERIAATGLTTEFVPAASVDHPPRRVASGWRLAKMHRATMLYMTLHPPRRSLAWFLQHQARERVARIRQMPWSLDSVGAIAAIPAELAGVMWHWREWKAWASSVAGRAR